jgi:EmrB/QacA subfamily drug resistance transporter
MTTTHDHDRRWTTLGVLCLSVFLVVVDNTIVNVALPSFARDLHSSNAGLQWIVDGYSLPFAALLLAGGAVADRLGRKPVMQIGLVGFMATSLWAALATSTGSLIAARASMGVAAAFIFPATLAILTTVFTDPTERAKAIGIWGATSGASVAVGPIVGGALLEHFWYGSVFLVTVPIAAVTLLLGIFLVPNSKAHTGQRFDWPGLVVSAAGLTLLVLTIIEGPTWGWGSPRTIGGFAISAVVLGIFCSIELRRLAPLLDVRVFGVPRFTAGATSVAVGFFCLFGFIFLITEYFQLVRGYSTLSAGVHTLPFAIATGIATPIGALLAIKFGARFVISGGLTLFAAGLLICAVMPVDASYFSVIIPSMVLMAAGLGFVTAPSTEAVMGSLRPDQVGAGAAVSNTTRELGGTLGVAVLGSVFASGFATRAIAALAGSGIPDVAAHVASRSVAASLAVASHAPQAPVAIAGVEHAFLIGLHWACFSAAGVAVVGALVAVTLLRGTASHQNALQ